MRRLFYFHNQGKTKVPLPICTAPEEPRTKNGGSSSQYIERCVVSITMILIWNFIPTLGRRSRRGNYYYPEFYCSLFTNETRFDRDNPPLHPIQDDSAWYLHSPGRWEMRFTRGGVCLIWWLWVGVIRIDLYNLAIVSHQ